MSSGAIASALKRGRGKHDAIVSITESSDGDNAAVIATNESEEGSSESANDGLAVRQSKRVKSESNAPDTSDSIVSHSSASSSSSSAVGLSEGGAVTMTDVQTLLGPIVSLLQSISQ